MKWGTVGCSGGTVGCSGVQWGAVPFAVNPALPLSLSLSLLPSLSLFLHTLAPDKEKCEALVRLFVTFLSDEALLRFIRLFLLQPNSSALRWQAHSLIHTLYLHGTSEVVHSHTPSHLHTLTPSHTLKSTFPHTLSGIYTHSHPHTHTLTHTPSGSESCG